VSINIRCVLVWNRGSPIANLETRFSQSGWSGNSTRDRFMFSLAGSTGVRRGEIIALRWREVDFGNNQSHVMHSVWRNVMGDAKTEASCNPVPLPTFIVDSFRS
jgi:hypothetical protein